MKKTEFKDRQSEIPNRRLIKIVSQNANEILADIEMADEPTQEGTPITAEVLGDWQDTILESNSIAETASSTAETAKTNSEAAVNTANTANGKSDTAVITANEANEKAASAVTTANEAKTTAADALTRVVEKQGTVVTESGNLVPTFDADQKVNVGEYNAAQETLKQRVQILETQPVMNKISYNSMTDTFTL